MERKFIRTMALIGDPTRATVLWTLLDGKAFTVTELALLADTTTQNMSMHLHKLLEADLITAEKSGRHKYYKFSRTEIAYTIEAVASLIPQPVLTNNIQNEGRSPIKYCRTCYDHLAGKIGVAISESLLRQKVLAEKAGGLIVTVKGRKWFQNLGIDIPSLEQQRRSLIRPCLDWSERRHHIAGSIGASLLDKMLTNDWIRRTKNSRAIVITGKGEKELHGYFNIAI